jgi:hypothetical protein
MHPHLHNTSTTRPHVPQHAQNPRALRLPAVLAGGRRSYSYSEGGRGTAPATLPPATAEGNTRRELAGVPGDGVLASFNESRDVVCIDDGGWKEGRAAVDQYLYEKHCKRRGYEPADVIQNFKMLR